MKYAQWSTMFEVRTVTQNILKLKYPKLSYFTEMAEWVFISVIK